MQGCDGEERGEERWFEAPMDWIGGDYSYHPPTPPPPRPSPPREPEKSEELQGLPSGRAPLVVGRFLPLHQGHVSLLRRIARLGVSSRVIVIEDAPGPLSGEERAGWIEDLGLPGVRVEVIRHEDPWDAADPGCIRRWSERIQARLQRAPVTLISCDPRDQPLGDALGIPFVPLAPDLTSAPASSAQLRLDPAKYWAQLVPQARSRLALRVALLGPEGSGKSTLASRLAEKFHTTWVPETLRAVMTGAGLALRAEHLEEAAIRQIQEADAAAAAGGRVLFLDTDLLSLQLWGERMFSRRLPSLERQRAQSRIDLYLLTEPVGGAVVPEVGGREGFWARCIEEASTGPHRRLSGALEERLRQAEEAVRPLLARPLW
jgi:HTH-type transcriptional repressor of NAD biosynthesis genes